MKDILTRLFNHEELTSEETKQILLNITREAYPEAQISALLTVFQMRSITVDELIGFREALMETRVPIDFAPYRPIDIVGTGGDGKNTFNISSILNSIIPSSVYNPETKKVFGILTAEDLLIVALIFLFSENSEDCDPLLIPALIYILLSDYIDLPELPI